MHFCGFSQLSFITIIHYFFLSTWGVKKNIRTGSVLVLDDCIRLMHECVHVRMSYVTAYSMNYNQMS